MPKLPLDESDPFGRRLKRKQFLEWVGHPNSQIYQEIRKGLVPADVRASPGSKPSPALEIDEKVAKLFNEGKISASASSTAYFVGRKAVCDSALIGDNYEQYRTRTVPEVRELATQVLRDAAGLTKALQDFAERYRDPVEYLEHLCPSLVDGEPRIKNVRDAIQSLRRDGTASLKKIMTVADIVLQDTPNISQGRPGRDWHTGFVWGMGNAWLHLVKNGRVSSKSEPFLSFVQAGFQTLDADSEVEWTTVVDTAIRRFGRKDGRWLKAPGDDLWPENAGGESDD
jgi:hypothetical protein